MFTAKSFFFSFFFLLLEPILVALGYCMGNDNQFLKTTEMYEIHNPN